MYNARLAVFMKQTTQAPQYDKISSWNTKLEKHCTMHLELITFYL